jgi:hypothetical protein
MENKKEKYNVCACPNCKNMNKQESICKIGKNEAMEDWYMNYGRLPQRKWEPSMDLDCYEPNVKSVQREEAKKMNEDFMSDLNNFLNK